MLVMISCPKCDKRLGVSEKAVGKRVKCQACSERFVVPTLPPRPAAKAATVRLRDEPLPAVARPTMDISCPCGTKLQLAGLRDGMKLTCHQCGKTLSIQARTRAEPAVSRDEAGLDAMAPTDLEAEDGRDSDERIRFSAGETKSGKSKRRLRFRDGFFASIWTGITARIARAVTRPVMLLREFGLPLFLLFLVGAGGWCWTVFRNNRADRAKIYQSFADHLGESVRGASNEQIDQPYLRGNVVVIEQHTNGYSICKDYVPVVLDPTEVGTVIRIRWIETHGWVKDSQGNLLTIGPGVGVPLTTVHAEIDLIQMVPMRVIASKELQPTDSPSFKEGDNILTHPPNVTVGRDLVIQHVDKWLSLPIKKD